MRKYGVESASCLSCPWNRNENDFRGGGEEPRRGNSNVTYTQRTKGEDSRHGLEGSTKDKKKKNATSEGQEVTRTKTKIKKNGKQRRLRNRFGTACLVWPPATSKLHNNCFACSCMPSSVERTPSSEGDRECPPAYNCSMYVHSMMHNDE